MGQSETSRSRRTGLSHRVILLVVPLLIVVPAVAWSVFGGLGGPASEDGPLMHVVGREDFVHEITERGNVESASNIEVRCEVQSQGSAGTRILQIVPEGTYVKKGDVICRLDASSFESEKMKQETVFHTAEAALIQAENDFDTAKIAKDEYDKGQFVLDEQLIASEIILADENLRKAKSYVEYSEKLRKKGFISGIQLEADKFAHSKAQKDLEAAKTKRDVLHDYTRRKMLGDLESNIRSFEAKLQAQKATRELEKKKLDLILTQIEKCAVIAPEDGQVVYASNASSRGGGNEVIIEEGAQVRERQVIVRLPDPKRMQVKAMVNESKIALVAPGQPASIRLDAFPDAQLTGVVEKVSEYPAQSSFWAANIKEYETVIRILDSSIALRPGYTAEVRVRVAQQANVVVVPIQSILEHAQTYYCVVRGASGLELRPVNVGHTNDKVAVIESGIDEGEAVVFSAGSIRDQLDLPTVEADAEEIKSESQKQREAELKDIADREPPKGGEPKPGAENAGKAGSGGDRDQGERP